MNKSSKVWDDVPVVKRMDNSLVIGYDRQSLGEESYSMFFHSAALQAAIFKWAAGIKDLSRRNILVSTVSEDLGSAWPIDATACDINFRSPTLFKSKLPNDSRVYMDNVMADRTERGMLILALQDWIKSMEDYVPLGLPVGWKKEFCSRVEMILGSLSRSTSFPFII